MSTKVLLLCVLIAELPAWVIPIPRWEEEPFESNLLSDREESMESRVFHAEQPEYRNRFLEQVKRVSTPEDVSFQQGLTISSSCSCETDFSIRNLGDGKYPNILSVAHCVEKPCHNKFNNCNLLDYKVWVLQERDISHVVDRRYKIDLPESLRDKWELVPHVIGVACIPSEGGRRH